MSERREISTDDVVRRLQGLPADAWEPPAAPPLRIDFGDAPASAPAPAAHSGLRAWLAGTLTLRPLAAASLASVLLLVGLAGGLLLGGGTSETTPKGDTEVRLAALPGAEGATAQAEMGGDLGENMVLHARGLPPSKPGEYYELWALNTPDDLAPIGTFRVGEDGVADVEFALGVDPERYAALDVSVEREDGNPGHSGDSLLRSSTPA